MIFRGIYLKDALTLYQDHFVELGELDPIDSLNSADWNKIADLIAFLKPLAEASKVVQTVATAGGNRALHTVLTQMEHLLDHLETSKIRQTHLLVSRFKACVNLS